MLMLHANDLLDQRLIEHGKFLPVYTNGSITDSIKEVIRAFNLTLYQKSVEIKLVQLLKIAECRFDKRRLQQVLFNLLSNAVKFTTQGVIKVVPMIIINEAGTYI